MENDFHRKVSQKIRLSGEGIDRFRVFTPFLFEDGDHLAIVLKKKGARWVLSDEAHTYMHLTYDIEEKDLHRGTQRTIISNTLAAFGIEDREGELMLEVEEEHYGDALYSFIQGLLEIAAIYSMSKEQARSTFANHRHTSQGAFQPRTLQADFDRIFGVNLTKPRPEE